MNNKIINKNCSNKIIKLPKDSLQYNNGIKTEFKCLNKKIPTVEIKEP